MKYRRTGSPQQGMTLVELLIAMLLGVFLTGGLIQIFVGSQQTYRMQESLSRLQENGRFAIDFLSRDIRMAGYRGCSSGVSLTIGFNPGGNYLYDFSVFIKGFEATSIDTWSPGVNMPDMDDMTAAAGTINSPTGGSDVVTVRRADDKGFVLASNITPADNLGLDAAASSPNLSADTDNFKAAGFLNSNGVNKCATAVISDCNVAGVVSADVFKISKISGTILEHKVSGCADPNNSSASLAQAYLQGAQVYPINTITYYVSQNPGNHPALYRRIGTNKAEEVVEGIESMEILYGVDTEPDGEVDYYANAKVVSEANAGLGDWSKVVSVRIKVLAVTIDDKLREQAVGLNFNGMDIPADRRQRRIFNATITLRNRAP
ncbi:MAG: PilW family protein [Methylococcales bacterium]|nr:PilW family protein [Methylococcales bacterium]